MLQRMPAAAMLASIAELPKLMNGSGTPVIGQDADHRADVDERLHAEPGRDAGGHQPAERVGGAARRRGCRGSRAAAKRATTVNAPSRPSSSPMMAKMKSVCASGRKPHFCVPSPRPTPSQPPEPSDTCDWTFW